MTQIQLKNPDIDMFNLPTAGIYLNFMQPKVEVDLNSLNDNDYNAIFIATRGQMLECSEEIISRVAVPPPPIPQPAPVSPATIPTQQLPTIDPFQSPFEQKPVVQEVKAEKNDIVAATYLQRKERSKLFVKLLDNNVVVIKKSLSKITDAVDLKEILKIERRGKKRKTIIDFIKKEIKKFENVVKDVSNTVDPMENVPVIPGASMKVDYTDEEMVEIFIEGPPEE